MADDRFRDIELDTFTESSVSPQVDIAAFTGIQVVMPESLPVGNLERIAVCGTWVMTGDQMQSMGDLDRNFVYLVRDASSHQSFTGNFRMHEEPATFDEGDADNSDDSDGPLIGPEDFRMQGFFNFNLARVWHPPQKAARYRLVIVLNEFQSNELEFVVRDSGE